MSLTGWRGLFWSYLTLAAGLDGWLWVRHPETLAQERRIPFRPRSLGRNAAAIPRRGDVMPVMVATGFVFGAQLTYFAVAADLVGTVYGRPDAMPALFALFGTGMCAALLISRF